MPNDTARSLRIAMIATGRIADNALAPAVNNAAGAELWSVLSRDAGRARDFAERHGAVSPEPAYTDLDTLLADPDLDAVLLASPDGLHAEQCIAAARAGKHVLCEKPMATTAADAERMTAACRNAGVKLGIAYHMRWHRGHRDLAGAAQAGSASCGTCACSGPCERRTTRTGVRTPMSDAGGYSLRSALTASIRRAGTCCRPAARSCASPR